MATNNGVKHALGRPVNFKGKDIYPIKMVDSEDFYELIAVILIEKSAIEDEFVIRMSYLTFLIWFASTPAGKQADIIGRLLELLSMVFRTINVDFSIADNGISYIHIDDKKFHQMDFDKIRRIIYDQNLIEFNEDIMETSNRKALEEARKFMMKHNKGKSAPLEQEIIAYHCEIGLEYEKIQELTIYQFRKGLVRTNHIKEADMMNTARLSGMVKFENKNDIPHWLGYIKDVSSDDMLKMSEAELAKLAKDLE